MLDTRTVRKEIVLTLTNNSTTSNSTISLFSFGSDSTSGGGGTSAYLQSVGINSSEFAGASNWGIRWYNFGSPTLNTYSIPDPTDIDDLITKLNAQFGDIFWYESDPVYTYSLRVASSDYNFITITPAPNPPRVFVTGTQVFISGTTIQVSMGYGVSYNSICTDLTTQPYLLTSMYVSSTDQTQSVQPLTTTVIDVNGISRLKPITPVVDPNQSQNVQMAIPIYMPTSAMNELQYTVLAGETAKIIVRYENIPLFDALQLMESGEFQKEMTVLKEQDQKEYERIMETVKGYDVIGNMEHPKSWTQPPVFAPVKQQEPIFAVPLIYSVARKNGNFFVEML